MARLKTNGHNLVKVGMKVMYRGAFGFGMPMETTLDGIELCESEHEKYGYPVNEVRAEDLYRCCVDLSDGHWAYGYQITEILG